MCVSSLLRFRVWISPKDRLILHVSEAIRTALQRIRGSFQIALCTLHSALSSFEATNNKTKRPGIPGHCVNTWRGKLVVANHHMLPRSNVLMFLIPCARAFKSSPGLAFCAGSPLVKNGVAWHGVICTDMVCCNLFVSRYCEIRVKCVLISVVIWLI